MTGTLHGGNPSKNYDKLGLGVLMGMGKITPDGEECFLRCMLRARELASPIWERALSG